MTGATERDGTQVEIVVETWEREDWRNAGAAWRWHCGDCKRYGPYDVTPMAVAKAAIEHQCQCKGL